jgi:hypothetical protein
MMPKVLLLLLAFVGASARRLQPRMLQAEEPWDKDLFLAVLSASDQFRIFHRALSIAPIDDLVGQSIVALVPTDAAILRELVSPSNLR